MISPDTPTVDVSPAPSPRAHGDTGGYARSEFSSFWIAPHEIGHARDKRERNRSLPEASASSAYFVTGNRCWRRSDRQCRHSLADKADRFGEHCGWLRDPECGQPNGKR